MDTFMLRHILPPRKPKNYHRAVPEKTPADHKALYIAEKIAMSRYCARSLRYR